MKPNKIWIMLTITLVCFFLIIPSSWAGSTQRHRWEGVAIGVGAAMLGHALFSQYYTHPAPVRVYSKSHYKTRPRRPRGHWEYKKVWVPPIYKKVWNPGHYNKRGRWVPGKWMRVEKEPGHWEKEKIWVTSR